MNVLTSDSLSIGYNSKSNHKIVLKDLTLSLSEKSLICLIGINGSGKSTLLRTLAKFQPSLEGEVKINNTDINDLSPKDLAKNIAVVLTHNEITGKMTVGEVIAMGRYPYTNWLATLGKEDEGEITNAMSLVGLNDYSTSYYDQLSDGQQQKVIIGRAVAQNTPIIILDEPTNHLDIGNKAEIFQLLQNLAHNSEKSILVSTHDLSLARQMADELWVIIDGKLVKGSPEKLELEGVLKEAFPYKGIDLISGKFVRLPTKGSIQVVGEGNVKMITEAAMVRIGYSIHEEASLKIEILDGPEWKVFSGSKATTFTDIDNLLRSLK